MTCRTCRGCKWWSSRAAMSDDYGGIDAACLNPESRQYPRMVKGGCEEYEAGMAVDDPSRTTPATDTP